MYENVLRMFRDISYLINIYWFADKFFIILMVMSSYFEFISFVHAWLILFLYSTEPKILSNRIHCHLFHHSAFYILQILFLVLKICFLLNLVINQCSVCTHVMLSTYTFPVKFVLMLHFANVYRDCYSSILLFPFLFLNLCNWVLIFCLAGSLHSSSVSLLRSYY